MAKQRIVSTHFWDDTFIIGLGPVEKLLFLYLITNPLTDVCGVYEISLDRIVLDTKIDREIILTTLIKFEAANKVTFRDGWVLIHNFVKNQKSNPSILQGIARSLNDCPKWARDRLYTVWYTGEKQTVYSLLGKILNQVNNSEDVTYCEDDTKASSGTDCIQSGTRDRIQSGTLNLTKPNLTKLNLTKPNLTESNRPVSAIADEEQNFVTGLLNSLRASMGVITLPSESAWSNAAAWSFRNNIPAADFIACYLHLDTQDWRKTAPRPEHVIQNLPKFLKSRDKGEWANG